MEKWDACAFPVDEREVLGRECYGGLDLSSSTDITAFVLVFPPRNDMEKYILLPCFWIPEENMRLRVRRDHVPYDVWERQGYLQTTEGNVIHYGFIENFIDNLGKKSFTLRRSHSTGGARCRWCRTLRDWDLQSFLLGRALRICRRPPNG